MRIYQTKSIFWQGSGGGPAILPPFDRHRCSRSLTTYSSCYNPTSGYYCFFCLSSNWQYEMLDVPQLPPLPHTSSRPPPRTCADRSHFHVRQHTSPPSASPVQPTSSPSIHRLHSLQSTPCPIDLSTSFTFTWHHPTRYPFPIPYLHYEMAYLCFTSKLSPLQSRSPLIVLHI